MIKLSEEVTESNSAEAMREFKYCKGCKQDVPLTDYYIRKTGEFLGNPYGRCIKCTNIQNKLLWEKHRTKYLIKQVAREKIRGLDPRVRKLRDEKSRRMRTKYPEKFKAGVALRNAVAMGKITKLPCENCGEVKVEAHHSDYTKPLDVNWLCHKDHMRRHNRWVENKI